MDRYLTSACSSSSVPPSAQKRKETLRQIKKNSTKKVRKGKTTEKIKPHARLDWNPKWPEGYPWVARRINSNNEPEMYCIWCTDYNKNSNGVFVVGTKTFKKDYLDMHLTTKEHQKAALGHTARPSDQTDLVIGFTIQANVDKLDIIAKMRCVYLCAKKHLAIDAFSNLVELMDL
jgi:hypothetical protein